jgi:hypothetical protein
VIARILGSGAAAAALLLASSPAAAARTADYSLSEAQYASLAADLGIDGHRPMPERGGIEIVLEDPAAIDHRVRVLGISCTAWNVDNPISQMVKRALTAWDRDGSLAAPGEAQPLIRVRLEAASSNLRCVQVKELKMRCLLRASLSGTATREEGGKPPRTEPLAIEVEQEQKMAGPCNGMAQGSSLLGRSASIALIDRLQALAAAD